jgi:hypothetical protein
MEGPLPSLLMNRECEKLTDDGCQVMAKAHQSQGELKNGHYITVLMMSAGPPAQDQ